MSFWCRFFIPIDRPDLGDGPLKGVKFVRCACAEKRAIYPLIRTLILGTKAQFRYEIYTHGESMKNLQKSVFTIEFYVI